MFRNASLAAALLVSLAIAGCGDGPPRFDVSSEESAKTSLERMTTGMSPGERDSFAKDMGTVVLRDGLRPAVQETFRTGKSAPADKTAVYKPLHGLTVAEIHERAESIRRELAEQAKPK